MIDALDPTPTPAMVIGHRTAHVLLTGHLEFIEPQRVAAFSVGKQRTERTLADGAAKRSNSS
jgi:hypothetical protein